LGLERSKWPSMRALPAALPERLQLLELALRPRTMGAMMLMRASVGIRITIEDRWSDCRNRAPAVAAVRRAVFANSSRR
jgi:hypothetical protein